MPRQGFVFAVAVLLSATSSWSITITQSNAKEVIPNLEMDMTSSEYSDLLDQVSKLSFDGGSKARTDGLQTILDMGKRNLDWLKFINDHRDSQHQISLSSAATQVGTPIETPRLYNPTLIQSSYQALIAQVPDGIKNVVLGTGAFPLNPPVADDQYIAWGRKLDASYQIAARWALMEPYLSGMASRNTMDVRGYYFLNKDPNVQSELENWQRLDVKTQSAYADYLNEMCLNQTRRSSCTAAVQTAIAQNKVYDLYASYLPASKSLWDNYFLIQEKRPDITWTASPETAHIPFRDPNNAKVKAYLADNIQDEWKWVAPSGITGGAATDWHLFLDFQTGNQTMPEVQFQAGSTPHVNGIAGDVITMDDNAPLTEYDVQWTIRHEFGHVLGFPDCYVEFYDAPNSVMISYQLDITNLMCSRRGHLQQRHYDEMRRVYGSGI